MKITTIGLDIAKSNFSALARASLYLPHPGVAPFCSESNGAIGQAETAQGQATIGLHGKT